MRLELHEKEVDLDEARVDSPDWLWFGQILDRQYLLVVEINSEGHGLVSSRYLMSP